MSIWGKSALVCAPVVLIASILTGCSGGESLEDLSVGYKLATIDGSPDVELYEQRIAQAAERCGESETAVADKAVALTQYLDTRGIEESNLWVLNGVLQAIPPSEVGVISCADVIGALGVLRINE